MKNFCPVCPRDAGGAQRELLLENGTVCHGCGYQLKKAVPYRCENMVCDGMLYWVQGGVEHLDAEPPHAEVYCPECGYTGYRYKEA